MPEAIVVFDTNANKGRKKLNQHLALKNDFASRSCRVVDCWQKLADEYAASLDWEVFQFERLFDAVFKAQQRGALKADQFYLIDFLIGKFESQKFIAKHVNVNEATISRWIQRGYLGSPDRYPDLYKYLNKHRDKIELASNDERMAKIFAEAVSKTRSFIDLDPLEPVELIPNREQCEILVHLFLNPQLAKKLINSVDVNCAALHAIKQRLAQCSWADATQFRTTYHLAATYLDFRKPVLLYVHALNGKYLCGDNPFRDRNHE